jgi:hypothetical protein
MRTLSTKPIAVLTLALVLLSLARLAVRCGACSEARLPVYCVSDCCLCRSCESPTVLSAMPGAPREPVPAPLCGSPEEGGLRDAYLRDVFHVPKPLLT